MPQLDFTTYASQIFWLFVSFSVLYFIMAKFALPRVGDILHSRFSKISSDIAKAEQLKQEAESAKADFTSSLTLAKEKARDLIDNVRKEAAKLAAVRYEELDRKIAIQEQDAQKNREKLQKETKEKMYNLSVELCQDIILKLIAKKIDRNIIEKEISKSTN